MAHLEHSLSENSAQSSTMLDWTSTMTIKFTSLSKRDIRMYSTIGETDFGKMENHNSMSSNVQYCGSRNCCVMDG